MRPPPAPGQIEKERERLIAHIHAAFAAVSREGGVSWHETGVIDDYGDEEEMRAARALDTDRRWTELIDDPSWDPEAGWGGFSFLDAIGFRYYLPVAMVRSIRSGRDVGIRFHLTIHGKRTDLRPSGRHAMLDDKQRHCIARFIRFMIAAATALPEGLGEIDADYWREALESGWDRF